MNALTAIVTTDLVGVTRGRSVLTTALEDFRTTGVGWLQANLALTAFSSIAPDNPWGSQGDLRLIPDSDARYVADTGSATPFDMVMGDIAELDGTPWDCCTRTQLKVAVDALRALGLELRMSVEQEFQIFGADFPPAHAFSFEALRRCDPFASRLMAALDAAGIEPEVVIAEFGENQFEVTCAPADPVRSADRAIAIRELTREIARVAGWRASFSPKTAEDSVGNGVHVHFSLIDLEGRPAGFDPDQPGRLSAAASAFCAGILKHLPAMIAFTAPSTPSYLRLQPHHWSSSYTWLADKDREASLRICPTATIGGSDPARQFNVEFRAADATANPYLVLTAIVRAGLEGLKSGQAAPVISQHPAEMNDAERAANGLVRLPQSLKEAQSALASDEVVKGWFPPAFLESLHSIRSAEAKHLEGLDPSDICRLYRDLY